MTPKQQINQLANSLEFLIVKAREHNSDDWGLYSILTNEIKKVHEVFVDTLEDN